MTTGTKRRLQDRTYHNSLWYISAPFGARGKRPHEVEILSEIIERGQDNKNFIISRIEQEYDQKISEREIESAISNLRGEFVSKEDERKRYVQIEIIQSMSTGMIRRMQSFYERLKHPLFYNYMQDLV